MFATIRKYRTKDAQRLTDNVSQGFAALSGAPGFVAYYALDAGDGQWVSFTIYESEEQARAHTAEASAWVKEHVARLMDGPPEIIEGRLVVRQEPGSP